MTTETTEPEQPEVPSITAQRAAFEALAAMAATFPELLSGYATVHTPMYGPATIGLGLRNPQGFEQWRTALQIEPRDIEVHADNKGAWLAGNGVFCGVEVHVTGFGLPLTPEQIAAPRDTAMQVDEVPA